MTDAEQNLFDGLMASHAAINRDIQDRESKNTIRLMQDDQGRILPGSARRDNRFSVALGNNPNAPGQFFAEEYLDAFHWYLVNQEHRKRLSVKRA